MLGNALLCCTRYGNVMCNRGSVIPLFIDQLKRGDPITITDPAMTRFLMSLDEAVALKTIGALVGNGIWAVAGSLSGRRERRRSLHMRL